MVSGKRVFVYDEQGLGDALQMARYVPLLAARGAIVYLRVAAELHRLFTGLQGVTALFGDADDVPAHDFQCPMMSLPLACGTCIETIPADIPYLSVRPEYVRAMGERLPACAGLPRLGLVWGGNPRNPTDGKRSLPLVRLLGALPDGYAYVALQKQMSQADADLLQTDPRVHNAADLLSDFEDTAAICSALDGLITVDTSVAHLAGALGLPVMLLVSCVPDWRWMLDRDDSPWYPSLTIIRQPKPGDWTGALSELQKRLLPG
jgi:hypothetical protein